MASVYVVSSNIPLRSERPQISGFVVDRNRGLLCPEEQLVLDLVLDRLDYEEGTVIVEVEGHEYFLEEFAVSKWEVGNIRAALLEWHQGRSNDIAKSLGASLLWAVRNKQVTKRW